MAAKKRKAPEHAVLPSMETSLLERYKADAPAGEKTLQWFCKETALFIGGPTSADEALHYNLGALVGVCSEFEELRKMGLEKFEGGDGFLRRAEERVEVAARQYADSYEQARQADTGKVVLPLSSRNLNVVYIGADGKVIDMGMSGALLAEFVFRKWGDVARSAGVAGAHSGPVPEFTAIKSEKLMFSRKVTNFAGEEETVSIVVEAELTKKALFDSLNAAAKLGGGSFCARWGCTDSPWGRAISYLGQLCEEGRYANVFFKYYALGRPGVAQESTHASEQAGFDIVFTTCDDKTDEMEVTMTTDANTMVAAGSAIGWSDCWISANQTATSSNAPRAPAGLVKRA